MSDRHDPLRELARSSLEFLRRFGQEPGPHTPVDSHIRNMEEEVREFSEAARARTDPAHIAEEAADIMVTVINVCYAAGLTIDQIVEGVYQVAAKNDAKTHETHVFSGGKIRRRQRSQD